MRLSINAHKRPSTSDVMRGYFWGYSEIIV
jgi:hypothetical protein